MKRTVLFIVLVVLLIQNISAQEKTEIKLKPLFPEQIIKPRVKETKLKKEKVNIIDLPNDILKDFDNEFIKAEEKQEPKIYQVEKETTFNYRKQENKEKQKTKETWMTSFQSKLYTLRDTITHKLSVDKTNTKRTIKGIINRVRTAYSNANVKFHLQKKQISRKMKIFAENFKKLFEKEPSIKLDLNENENEIIVIVNAPGVDKQDIKIIVENKNEKNFLVISGKYPKDVQVGDL
eukprot:gene2688-3884_t